uniref:DoxX family protein n=1 Tax=Nonomuraea antri TaxID=2730852 RepID=UPI00156A4F50|nr:DoxX family protein [Nonomuraea antri]NRQ40425.1 hypothetical protein [Nonomuraea antri]
MFVAYVVVTVLTIAANAAVAVADLARSPWVLGNMASVGIAERWLPPLAAH